MVKLQESEFAVPGLDGCRYPVVGLPVQLTGVGREGEGEESEGCHRVENNSPEFARAQPGGPEGRHHRVDQPQQAEDCPGRNAVGEEQVELSPGEGEAGVDTELGPGHVEADSLPW